MIMNISILTFVISENSLIFIIHKLIHLLFIHLDLLFKTSFVLFVNKLTLLRVFYLVTTHWALSSTAWGFHTLAKSWRMHWRYISSCSRSSSRWWGESPWTRWTECGVSPLWSARRRSSSFPWAFQYSFFLGNVQLSLFNII